MRRAYFGLMALIFFSLAPVMGVSAYKLILRYFAQGDADSLLMAGALGCGLACVDGVIEGLRALVFAVFDEDAPRRSDG